MPSSFRNEQAPTAFMSERPIREAEHGRFKPVDRTAPLLLGTTPASSPRTGRFWPITRTSCSTRPARATHAAQRRIRGLAT
jgi:hypothetical protein